MNACGLVHSNRLTTPVTVVGLAMLYMAVEWCANEGIAPGSMPSAIARAIVRKFMLLKPPLFLFLEKPAVIGIVLANEFVHFGHLRTKREASGDTPRFRKNIRIFQCRVILKRVEFG